MKIYIYVNVKKLPGFFYKGISEYIKRISPFSKIELILSSPGQKLQKKLSSAYVIKVIDGNGLTSSECFAEKLKENRLSGKSCLSFIIGYEDTSFDEELSLLSTSAGVGIKTLLLTEQIYRAFMISENRAYHK